MLKNKNIFKISWFGLSFGLILMAVIGFFTWSTLKRTETSVTMLLVERGAAILNIAEKIIYSRRSAREAFQLQILSEDIVQTQGVDFFLITDGKGKIIIHSNPQMIGKKIRIDNHHNTERSLAELEVSNVPKWKLLHIDNNLVFAVYKELNAPLPKEFGNSRFSGSNGNAGSRFPKKHDLQEDHSKDQVLYGFVGQNASLYIKGMGDSRFVVISVSLGIFIVAAVLLLVLQFTSRNKELQKRQEEAERIALEMVEKVKILEKDLRQKEKLAAIGDLTAGVAHEIRNPLSSIKGYATYFKQIFAQSSPNSSEEKAAKIMIEEVDRLNRAIDELIGVSRAGNIKLQEVNITELCKKICFLLEPEAEQKAVELHCISSLENDFNMKLDPDRLRQALLNIALNAMEAFGEKKDDEEIRKVSVFLEEVQGKDKKEICISVTDTACGISDEIISRIFDPYFTTKSKGTGLGLVVAKNIVEAHKGRLEVSSNEIGTKFKIFLPV